MNDYHERFKERFTETAAALEHERWARWQEYLHSLCTKNDDGSLTIPASRVARWERQIATPYKELSDAEKESDREEVRKHLPDILAFIDEEIRNAVMFTGNYVEGVHDGKRIERTALIEKVEGMRRILWSDDVYQHNRNIERENVLSELLTYLREPDASQGCCQFCASGGDYEVRKCNDCECHSPQGCCEKCTSFISSEFAGTTIQHYLCKAEACPCHSQDNNQV